MTKVLVERLASERLEGTSCHAQCIDRSATVASLPHICQDDNWDCGLACASMACGFVARRWVETLGAAAHAVRVSGNERCATNATPECCGTGEGEIQVLAKNAWIRHVSDVAAEMQWRPSFALASAIDGASQQQAPSPSRNPGSAAMHESVWTIDLVFVIHRMLCELFGATKPLAGGTAEPTMTNSEGASTAAPCASLLGCGSYPTALTGPFARLVAMSTIQPYAATTHRDLPFYRDTFDVDAARVDLLFHAARTLQWSIHDRHMPTGQLLAMLGSGHVVVICLVNAVRLRCPCNTQRRLLALACCCQDKCCDAGSSGGSDDDNGGGGGKQPPEGPTCCRTLRASLYVGHFVVLCGYDRINRKVLYRNPARLDEALCAESLADLDAARRATGTDEDLIVVDTRHWSSSVALA